LNNAAKGTNLTTYNGDSKRSFCTHIFSRAQLSIPIVSLVGLEDPSIAVRCSPVLYKLIDPSGGGSSGSSGEGGVGGSGEVSEGVSDSKVVESMIPGAYRMIFAVVTVSAVMVYDTQHQVTLSLSLSLSLYLTHSTLGNLDSL
jgi:chromatin assembly factor 1 subunit B